MSDPKPMPTYWSLAEEVTHLHGRLDQLEAENAKLRELCKDMWHGAMRCMDYEKFLLFAGEIVDKMRELRVKA